MKEKKENCKKIEKLYKYIIVFIIPIICMLIHMAMKECYPFGKNTILIGDANIQYYSFFMELADKIKNGGSFFFSWNKGMGYDFYSNFFYYLASPFNIIALFFGKAHMELGMAITMLVQVGMCGVTMLYYLAHTRKNKMKHGILNDCVCILFALAYAMCDYIVAYQYNILWLITLLLIPIMMLGIERMIEKDCVRLYFVTLFLIFVTNFYFAWFACIFAVIWFIDQKKSNVKDFFKKFVRFAITSVVSAMCAAFVLLPCFLAVSQREDKWVELSDYSLGTFGKIGNFIQSFFWGCEIDKLGNSLFTNNNYCGIFVLILCLAFVFNKKIDTKQKVKRIIEMLLIAFCLNWIVSSYVLHGFTIPHMFTNRYAFILLILMIVTAFECVTSYETIRLRWIAAMLFISIIGVAIAVTRNDSIQNMMCYMISILLIIYLILLFVFSRRNRIKKKSLIINVIIIGFVELISNFFFVNGDSYDVSKDYKCASKEWADIYENIDTDNMERKTSWVNSENNTTYSDTNLYASSINSNLLWLFDDLGLVYQTNGGSYAYRGATPVTSLMFNVRNVLTDQQAYYGGYDERESFNIYNEAYDMSERCGIYESSYISGIGYTVSDDILNWNIDDISPFAVQNDFVEKISGVEDVFTKVETNTLEDFDVKCNGCMLFKNKVDLESEKKSDNLYFYQNLLLDGTKYSAIQFKFTVPYDMDLYIYIQDRWRTMTSVYVNGELYGNESIYPSPKEILSLGKLQKGQEVVLLVYNNSQTLEKGTTIIDFYEYHDDKMQECLKTLEGKGMDIESAEDTYIKAHVNAEEDSILYTSIPYYKGFKVYVDGNETDIIGLASDALIGVNLTKGEHMIEFKYMPYGLKAGLIISCLGIGIAVVYIVMYRKRKSSR
ncbi:MAG: YfhO family protein [Coprococcus sp.]